MTGVGATPRSITSCPQASSAEIAPSRIMTPLERGSRPTSTTPGDSRNVPKAQAKSRTWAAVKPVPTMPRSPTCEMRSDFMCSRGAGPRPARFGADGALAGRGPAPLLHQLQAPERFRHVIRRGIGRLPRDPFAPRTGPLNPVEIDAHFAARLRLALVHLCYRNAHRGIPDLLIRIDTRGN